MSIRLAFRLALGTTLALSITLLAAEASAAVYVCKGERIEKNGSTWGYARSSGSDYRIEKGSSSIGWAKKAGSYWRIETFGGSTLGWLKGSRIEKPGGSTWASLDDAKKLAECSDPIAAALWILNELKKL